MINSQNIRQHNKYLLEHTGLYAPINICCADVHFVTLLYTSLEHLVMPCLQSLYYCINDARSHKHQIAHIMLFEIRNAAK